MPLDRSTPLATYTGRLHFVPPPAGNAQGDDGDAAPHTPRMRSDPAIVYQFMFHAIDTRAGREALVKFKLPASAPRAARRDPDACGGAPLFDALAAGLPHLRAEGGLLDGMDPAACTLGAVRGLIAGGAVAVRDKSFGDLIFYWVVDLATGQQTKTPGWIPLRWGLPHGRAAAQIAVFRKSVEVRREREARLAQAEAEGKMSAGLLALLRQCAWSDAESGNEAGAWQRYIESALLEDSDSDEEEEEEEEDDEEEG